MKETAWPASGGDLFGCTFCEVEEKKAKEWANKKLEKGVVGPFGQRCIFEKSLQSGS